ncbi:MAG: DUF3800 domain-containing protein [Pirellulales bacterium]|nr:DUF3800 domain-containing protein [Pirellulales bacterium]
MSWLLFMDESGHDHKTMPYEVRGGVALHDRKVWPFIRAVSDLEQSCFGMRLSDFKKEFKGEKLLDKDRFRWSRQDVLQADEERRRNVRAFLTKGLQKVAPTRAEFTGYGQACIQMAQGIFRLLRDHDAKIFAAAIPRSVQAPDGRPVQEYLRKDHVYLLERFYYFVHKEQEQGLLVMDQVEEQEDYRFVRKLERYFVRTTKGAQRADWIVPSPFFSSSYLSIPIQVADVCIYCINWGLRRWEMNARSRAEIEAEFAGWIRRLEYQDKRPTSHGKTRKIFGIVFVHNPYGPGERRTAQ